MKAKVILLTLALGVSTCLLTAQDGPAPRDGQRPPGRDGGPGGPGMFRGQRPMDPITEALDMNKDGIIDAEEIAKATESLKKLDKNGDAKLTVDEIRPPRPGGRGGPDAKTPGVAAQQPPPREDGPGAAAAPAGANDRRPLNPIVAALDLNKDGVIDADEMIKASESLKALDKNSDGKLTADEFRPARPGGRCGRGGPGGPGAPGGPGMGGEDRPQARSLDK